MLTAQTFHGTVVTVSLKSIFYKTEYMLTNKAVGKTFQHVPN